MIAEELDLDMPGTRDATFEVDARVAERRAGFGAGPANRTQQVASLDDRPHAFSAASQDGFNQERIPDRVRGLLDCSVRDIVAKRRLRTWNERHARLPRRETRRRFASHEGDRLRRRTDESQSLLAYSFRELFVFRKES